MSDPIVAALVVSIFFGVVSALGLWIVETVAGWLQDRKFLRACESAHSFWGDDEGV